MKRSVVREETPGQAKEQERCENTEGARQHTDMQVAEPMHTYTGVHVDAES